MQAHIALALSVVSILATHCHAAESSESTFSIPASYHYSPWRELYYTNPPSTQAHVCPFCDSCKQKEDENYHILYRAKHCYIKLNDFPPTKGSLLILPYEHCGDLTALSPEATNEIMHLAKQALPIIRHAFEAEGFHLGFNLGNYAGASIPDHLHLQIVPRYNKHVGFIETIGSTTLIVYDLEKVYATLLPHFKQLE